MDNIKYVCNAFSLQMVIPGYYNLEVRPMTQDEFEFMKDQVPSAVGHPDTANVLGVECNRENVSLHYGDAIIVAQLMGGRLPEGARKLPEGFAFKYFTVKVIQA